MDQTLWRGSRGGGRSGDLGARVSFLPSFSGQGSCRGWTAWRQGLNKMTSRVPGQCPGIWGSVIHKDMVTLEKYTEAGSRV